MNTRTSQLGEIGRHRAIAAGEFLGEAILALSRWLSRAAQALRASGAAVREPAHTPR